MSHYRKGRENFLNKPSFLESSTAWTNKNNILTKSKEKWQPRHISRSKGKALQRPKWRLLYRQGPALESKKDGEFLFSGAVFVDTMAKLVCEGRTLPSYTK